MTDGVSRFDKLQTLSLLQEVTENPESCVVWTHGDVEVFVRSSAGGWTAVYRNGEAEVNRIGEFSRPDGLSFYQSSCDEAEIRSLARWPEDPIPEPFDAQENVSVTGVGYSGP